MWSLCFWQLHVILCFQQQGNNACRMVLGVPPLDGKYPKIFKPMKSTQNISNLTPKYTVFRNINIQIQNSTTIITNSTLLQHQKPRSKNSKSPRPIKNITNIFRLSNRQSQHHRFPNTRQRTYSFFCKVTNNIIKRQKTQKHEILMYLPMFLRGKSAVWKW